MLKLDPTKPVEFIAVTGDRDISLPARIICSDRKGNSHYPIIALIDNMDGLGGEKAVYFTPEGSQGPYPSIYGHLRNKKETFVRWCVVIEGPETDRTLLTYDSEEAALKNLEWWGMSVVKKPFKIEVELD